MMQNIDWGLAAQHIIYGIGVLLLVWLYVEFILWMAEKLAEADELQQKRADECSRLALLSTIAEEIEVLPDSPERRRLYREAEALGFLDSDDLPRSA